MRKFVPSHLGSRMVSESITPFFHDAWGRWKEFHYNIREYGINLRMIIYELLKCCLKLEKIMRSPVGYEKAYRLNFGEMEHS
ncbi:hypothetical protein RDI58_013359 [Solanum bulbocastanum]|uniref:Uncharacterized protein n=1 Tax=Solanum bulbocastanum TaxID=147425 RepID=A0AAN8TMN8_SOLBU